MSELNRDSTFHLAITMAGASTAGCYTAGVMDYIFEILDLWEKARLNEIKELQKHQDKIPNHRVVIEAMGGTSAGGMTSTMSAIYALKGTINPVKEPGLANEIKNNVLYDSWVLMDDDNKGDKRPLIQKIWDTDDLEEGKLGSLLNSKFIDIIADRAFPEDKVGDIKKSVERLPSYVSPNLQLLYSHCFLRGIPLQVNFETKISKTGRKSVIPNHTTLEHYIVTQYHLNNGEKPDTDKYLWLNPYEKPYSDILKLSTKATGAFPIGLIYREFTPEHLGEGYLKTVLKRVITGQFGKADPDLENKIALDYFPKNYGTLTVDGGAINNEPYREVLSILKDQYDVAQDEYPRYGVVMIDPFPDRAQLSNSYTKPNDVLDVTQSIISTLTDQSRIKRREMLEADTSSYFKSIIFPRKWKTDKNGKPTGQPKTIACASAMAFGGFLDIGFRQHDFFLGRNNARNFVRYFFSFPYILDEQDPSKNDIHPIHRDWTPQMIEAFKIVKEDGIIYLPIIPDLNILIEDENNDRKGRFHLDISETPKFDPEKLFGVQKSMVKRLRKILNIIHHRDFSDAIRKEKEAELAKLPTKHRKKLIDDEKKLNQRLNVSDDWIKSKYRQSFLSRLGSIVIYPIKILGISIGKRIASKAMAKKIIQTILIDLAGKGLLKERKN